MDPEDFQAVLQLENTWGRHVITALEVFLYIFF